LNHAFKQKLGLDHRRYTILGACNAPLAYQALVAAPGAGVLLPCNVIVDDAGNDSCVIRLQNPRSLLQASGLDDNPVLKSVADDAYARLRRVEDSLRDQV